MAKLQPTLNTVTTINTDGSRRFIHPADVRGRFTTLRMVAGFLLMAVYVGLPWIPINGNPAVFLDIDHRQLHLFGITLSPQDYWLGFFLITGTGFTLFYLTALVGRVWCGWACPQTVFLDIIRRIERWIEGDAQARERLDKASWTNDKIIKRLAKHGAFAVFSLLLSHVFISYFVSLPGLYAMVRQSPLEHWSAFVFVFLLSGALWFNFAWFREQFCIVMCPYGRLQSALIDDDSVVIGYDKKRGEPRGKVGTEGVGDCIDCRRCVQVCPTGIDIRQGLQLECIACSACIDACDTVMEKIQRPKGLIRYDSTNGLAGGKTRYIRPRILLYTVLLLIGATVMSFSLSTFKPATVSLQRMTGSPYYLMEDGIRNQYLLRIINKQNKPETFRIRVLSGVPGLQCTGTDIPLALPPLGEEQTPVVAVMPKSAYQGGFTIRFAIQADGEDFTIEKSVPFLGP